MKTICIARLRSRVNYKPLSYIMDCTYDLLKDFVEKNEQYQFTYYNFSWDKGAKRNLESIQKADIIVIPSEAEFQYHIPGYIHTLDWKTSQEEVAKVYEILKAHPEKKIVIIRSDRKDDCNLYRTRTFPGIVNEIREVEEVPIQSNRYHLIEKFRKESLTYESAISKKELDFCYYGCDKTKDVGGVKSGDLRGAVIKELYHDSDLSKIYIGRFNGFKAHMKFDLTFSNIIPSLEKARTTVCFNWPNFPKSATTRYHEALAMGVIPLVWWNYDQDNEFVCEDWQRCKDYQELKEKIISLRDPKVFEETYSRILKTYLETKLKSRQDLYEYLRSNLIDRIEQ